MHPIDQMTLRPLEEADIDAVKGLHALAFERLARAEHSAEQIAAHAAMMRHPDYEADLKRSHLMLATLADGFLVGTAGWIAVPEEPRTARIRKVFVQPAFARHGIASRLVADAERRAAAAGHDRLIVRANINAVPLYRKLGYAPLRPGTMPVAAGVELPVLFMEKTPAPR